MSGSAGLSRLSGRDTARVIGTVLIPMLAQGVILRRPAVLRLAARLDADARAITALRRLQDRYGAGPLLLRLPGRPFALVLAPAHVERVLAGTPQPFTAATTDKRVALRHFQPHAVLVTACPSLRRRRRALNEAALATGTARHPCADHLEALIRAEVHTLLAQARVLDWPAFHATWWQITRQVVLGRRVRDDHAVTEALDRLRAAANWAWLHPARRGERHRLHAALGGYVQRAEPGSLAARLHAAARAANPQGTGDTGDAELDAAGQVPHWLFAFDAAGIATFRALALLASHPQHLAAARAQHGDDQHPVLRAAVLESVRLWPTTMLILRQASTPVDWDGHLAPANTTYLLVSSYLHRNDRQNAPYADRFTPEIWSDGTAAANPGLVPFSRGPAACPGRNLVLLVAATALAAMLEGHHLKLATPAGFAADRPLPATVDHTRLRFAVDRRGGSEQPRPRVDLAQP